MSASKAGFHVQAYDVGGLKCNKYDQYVILKVVIVTGGRMPNLETARCILSKLFAHRPVADLATLQRALGVTSRTSVFRALSPLGYLTSYSHAGRYYTLEEVPRFDQDGLWAHGEVLFSRHGTLRASIIHFVGRASAGQSHAELQTRLRLRVHDTLRDLVLGKHIGRVEMERLYLYVSVNQAISQAQLLERRRLLAIEPSPRPLPESSVVIEILLAVVHHPKADPVEVAAVLRRQGKLVTREQVDAVFVHYSLKKKVRAFRHSRG